MNWMRVLGDFQMINGLIIVLFSPEMQTFNLVVVAGFFGYATIMVGAILRNMED